MVRWRAYRDDDIRGIPVFYARLADNDNPARPKSEAVEEKAHALHGCNQRYRSVFCCRWTQIYSQPYAAVCRLQPEFSVYSFLIPK
jgi:hypothetical protein